jgi:hypothetical protein
MTKVEAIKELMHSNGGMASWKYIYDNIESYYPSIKTGSEWAAALRGVLYREIKNNQNFKKIGFGVFALKEYQEEKHIAEIKKDTIRMHSYIEGIMIELGNYEEYATYCADPRAIFQEKVTLNQLTTINEFPNFTYSEIVEIAKRIDVIWFSRNGYRFPKRVIEIVDSIGTLADSLSRLYQLKDFQTDFYILAPEKHINKIERTLNREPYMINRDRFIVKRYDDAILYYNNRLELERTKF